jgi:hypothetical protein
MTSHTPEKETPGPRLYSNGQVVGLTERNLRKWARRFLEQGQADLSEQLRPGRIPLFLAELARKLKADGLVSSISAETIRRIFNLISSSPGGITCGSRQSTP